MLDVARIMFLAVAIGFTVTTLANLGTTVYMHRALAHKALKLHPFAIFIARVTIWLSTGIRPRQWVAVHRKHHAFTDQEGDPHSPLIGLLAAFVHLNAYLAGSAAVNAIAHHFGRKPYANGAGNLQWLALLTAGEGLHNNHHAAPTSARLSHRWYELDPGWWLIKGLSVVRLAKVRLATVRLKPSAHRIGA